LLPRAAERNVRRTATSRAIAGHVRRVRRSQYLDVRMTPE
jgi:hypothetical protein